MRLGLHRMSPDADDAFRAYVDAVRPPIVKFLDPGSGDEPLAAWCVQRGVAVVGRVYFEDQHLGAEGGRQIRRVVAAAHACPSIHWWELHNESWHVPGEMARYSALSIEFMDQMRAIGRGAVIGCFSEGTPQVDGSDNDEAWRQYLAALAHAIRDDHALGLHEYSAPIVQFAVEADGRGWHTLRYRRSREVWRKLGLVGWDRLRIFITEYGLDDIQDAKRPGPSGKGWRDYDGTEWSRPPLSPAGDFAGQTAWYCHELGKDPQVGGVVDFGWSARDKDSWQSFDMADTPAMQDRMIAEMQRLPRGAADAPPPPPPEVTMIEGIDVARYQGTVDWRKAAAAGARFAWCKATEGTGWIDPRFHDNARGAAAAGILVGAYHYYRNELDPRAQAHHLASVCAQHQLTLPPALDFEDTASPANPAAMRAFCEEVGRLMGRPVIYTASWWWTRSRLGGAQPWASAYPLWVADYDGAVALPGDWSDWTIHQFTSSGHGPTYGAESARIDRSRYRGTVEQLATLRQSVATELDVAALVAAAEAEHQERGVRFNPGAGIQRAILADGYVPTTNERDHDDASGHYVYQRAERLAGGEPRVYVWDPRAGAVRWVPGGVA